jgi:hypothetical protein
METQEMLKALWELQCAGNDENSRYMSAEEKMQDHLHGVYDNAAFSNGSGENKEAGKTAVKAAKELIQRGRELKAQGYALRIGWQHPAGLPPNPLEIVEAPIDWFDCSNGYANGTSQQVVRVYLVNYRDLTIQETSEIFGVESSVIRRACLQGKIPARKSGAIWLIKYQDAHTRWAKE